MHPVCTEQIVVLKIQYRELQSKIVPTGEFNCVVKQKREVLMFSVTKTQCGLVIILAITKIGRARLVSHVSTTCRYTLMHRILFDSCQSLVNYKG